MKEQQLNELEASRAAIRELTETMDQLIKFNKRLADLVVENRHAIIKLQTKKGDTRMTLTKIGVGLLLVAAAIALCSNAHAGPPMGHPLIGSPVTPIGSRAEANALGLGVGQGGQGGLGGAAVINNEAANYSDLRIVPPAIAPSVSHNIICPMVMQGSKAGSFFFFSGSGTHEPDLVPICIAFHLRQPDVVEAIACAGSKEYRKANGNCVQDGETQDDRDFRLLKAKANGD